MSTVAPIYKDINSQYGSEGFSDLLSNAGAINNSLYNLLTCPIGSRGFQPDYGSLLQQYIFEPCDDYTARKIEINFIQAIDRWEPRIVLDVQRCTVLPNISRDGYDVTLYYYIPALDKSGQFSMSVTR